MSQFRECLVKYTANYRTPDDVNNFKIRIKIACFNDSEEITFKWQEKVFSRNEIDLYSVERNCVTDLEKKYHLDVGNLQETVKKINIFSYVNDDEYNVNDEYTSYLRKGIDEIVIEDREYDFKNSVIDSAQNHTLPDNFEVMYIMADLGEYIGDTWISNETVLCTLKYVRHSKILTVFPDFNPNQAYYVHVNRTQSKTYSYTLENISNDISKDEEFKESDLLAKVAGHKAKLSKQIIDMDFETPPKNKLQVYMFFEIRWAKQFEFDRLFVQYFIDLPDNWSNCGDLSDLRGMTQTCVTRHDDDDDDGLAHFGHSFEIILDFDIFQLQSEIPKCPYIYFEVISKDSWNRYRTEGLTYKNLPVAKPGTYRYDLQCFRLIPQSLSGRLRRFFIGDCSNYRDVTWIGLPNINKDYQQGDVLNKYGTNTLGTGQLELRLNVIHQSQAFLERYCCRVRNGSSNMRNREIFEKLNSSSLIKSVEQVLEAFRKARKNMIEARKNV